MAARFTNPACVSLGVSWTKSLQRPLQSVGECSQGCSKVASFITRGVDLVCTSSGIRRHYCTSTSGSHSVTQLYQSLVSNGTLSHDAHQQEAVDALQRLQGELEDPGQGLAGSVHQSSWLRKVFGGGNTAKNKIKGIYMYGSVGAGKTMLMDLFYKSTNVTKKQRLHFNEFMMDAHKRIHKLKQSLPAGGSRSSRSYDPIGPVAHDIASEVNLLCFDEFQVTDIGDAMILKRLFTTLFEDGVVVVATSNRPPDDLYKHGLQRGNFLPFIDILKKYCSIVQLSPGIDYRHSILGTDGEVYLQPNSTANNDKLMEMFKKTSQDNGCDISPKTLEFFGRHLKVERVAGKVAYFKFSELCDQPLSAVDFLEISRAFEVVFLQDVPCMTKSMRPQAKRFITLVDTLYDHKVKLVCTASGSPSELLFSTNTDNGTSATDEERVLMDDLGIDQATASETSIFTGEEELFASARTVSRLKEMQGKEYWESEHIAPRRN